MTQAYEMAVNALGLSLISREQAKEPIPEPSQPEQILVDNDSFLVIIEFDMIAYKKRTNPRAVKKTLTIPEWLNEEAVAMGVNFSQVLQEALIKKSNRTSIYIRQAAPALTGAAKTVHDKG